VRLKPGIMDVQGTAVQRALDGLGFSDLRGLRIGKVIEMEIEAASVERARGRAEDMCRQLLANPVLEDFAIEATPESGATGADGLTRGAA
jgi:phosphoribosylformylglycinamidine synthase